MQTGAASSPGGFGNHRVTLSCTYDVVATGKPSGALAIGGPTEAAPQCPQSPLGTCLGQGSGKAVGPALETARKAHSGK